MSVKTGKLRNNTTGLELGGGLIARGRDWFDFRIEGTSAVNGFDVNEWEFIEDESPVQEGFYFNPGNSFIYRVSRKDGVIFSGLRTDGLASAKSATKPENFNVEYTRVVYLCDLGGGLP